MPRFAIIIIAICVFITIASVNSCSKRFDEDTVNVEAFFAGEKGLGDEVELANVFSYLMTGSLHLSNAPKINIEDIDQDALRQILTEEFWARQSN